MPTPRRLLLTGATGYLGHHLLDALRRSEVDVVAAGVGSGPALRLDDRATLAAGLRAAAADVVLHAAAMSSLPRCEREPELAQRVNAEATAELAAGPHRTVLVSTDLVFAGDAAPYRSGDEPRPLSAYGRSKAAAERAVLAAGGLVVRLPLLFGPSFDGRRGATDMLRAAAADGRRLRLFADEFRTPLHVREAAEALVALALSERTGVVHAAGPERISRSGLAWRMAAVHGWQGYAFDEVPCDDPLRPRDVTLVGDVEVARSLDDMLRDS